VQRLLLALALAARLARQAALDPPPQHHHPPRTAPACQPEFAFHRVEALANPLPVTLLPLPLNQSLNPGSLSKLEEVALLNPFHLGHHPFIAKGTVAAHQGGAFLRGEPLHQQAQARQAVFGRTGFAALHFDIEHQTEVADPVRVQGMARASRLGGVVADLGARLVAVQQLDGGVGVENPGGTQGLAGAFVQGRVHPGRTPRQLECAGRAFRFATTLGLVRRQMG